MQKAVCGKHKTQTTSNYSDFTVSGCHGNLAGSPGRSLVLLVVCQELTLRVRNRHTLKHTAKTEVDL